MPGLDSQDSATPLLVVGFGVDITAVTGKSHLCGQMPAPGPRGVRLSRVAAGCTHLAWVLRWGSIPTQTLLSPGLQTLSRQVQGKTG